MTHGASVASEVFFDQVDAAIFCAKDQQTLRAARTQLPEATLDVGRLRDVALGLGQQRLDLAYDAPLRAPRELTGNRPDHDFTLRNTQPSAGREQGALVLGRGL